MEFYRSLKDKDFDFDFKYLKEHELEHFNITDTSAFAEMVFTTMSDALQSSTFLNTIKDNYMNEINEKINLIRDYPDDREIVAADIDYDEMLMALGAAHEIGLFQEFNLQDNPSNLMVIFMAMYEIIMKHQETRRDFYQIIDYLHVGNRKSDIDDSPENDDQSVATGDDLTPGEDQQDKPEKENTVISTWDDLMKKVNKHTQDAKDKIEEKARRASEAHTLEENIKEALSELGIKANVHVQSISGKDADEALNTLDKFYNNLNEFDNTMKKLIDDFFKNIK